MLMMDHYCLGVRKLALKYDLTPGFVDNPLLDLFLNTIFVSNTVLSYVYIAIFGIISYYVIQRQLDDTGLSLAYTGGFIWGFSVLMFYLGIESGVTVVHGVYMILLTGTLALGVGWLYYSRGDS